MNGINSVLSNNIGLSAFTTMLPNMDDRSKKSQNMTECVPVPSSEHVAEIVGRQGNLIMHIVSISILPFFSFSWAKFCRTVCLQSARYIYCVLRFYFSFVNHYHCWLQFSYNENPVNIAERYHIKIWLKTTAWNSNQDSYRSFDLRTHTKGLFL